MPRTPARERTRVRMTLRTRITVPLARDDEGEDEPEEGERLGEGDAEEHGGAHHAGGLRLTGHRGDGVADDDADADARTDGGAAVHDAATDRGQSLDELAGVL